jgi:hypothetical protein
MTDELTVQTLAQEARGYFKQAKRTDGSEYWSFDHDTTPQWVQDLAYAGHDRGGMFPDDWRYEFIVEALDALSDDDEPELEANIYTSELCDWLASHGSRPSYCDEAHEEWGSVPDSIVAWLQWGQLREREEVLASVKSSLENHLAELQSEQEDESADGDPDSPDDEDPHA